MLQSRGTGVKRNPNEVSPAEYIEPTSIASRKKGKHRKKLTVTDKINIVHRIMNLYHPAREVAKELRIS